MSTVKINKPTRTLTMLSPQSHAEKSTVVEGVSLPAGELPSRINDAYANAYFDN